MDLKDNMRLINGVFKSDKVKMENLISSSNNLSVKMNYEEYSLELCFNSKMSHILIENNIDFNENIMTNIISINSTCKFYNILSTKVFYVADSLDKRNRIRVFPMETINFNFFNRGKNCKLCFGISNLNETSPQQWSNDFIYQLGLFTFYLSNSFINLEIRKDPIDNNIEIFVSESTIDNCKIAIENKTILPIAINETYFDEYMEIVNPNEKCILKMFSQNYLSFQIIIQNRNYSLNIDPNEKCNKYEQLSNDIILNKISNGIKMHLIFYNKINLKKDENSKFYYFNVKINGLGISIIGDNEKKNKNLTKYKRNEILFFYLKNITLLIDRKIEGRIIKIALINTDFNIEKIRLYNQSIENGKYYLIMENNNNFCSLQTNIMHYFADKVSVINKIKLELDKIKLSLDPSFIISIIDFISNIIYRMNLRDFNVDKIFLNRDRKK